MKERRATILVGHSFCTYVTKVGGTFPLYSHPSVIGLISGTSAVSLFPRPEEKTRLLSSSPTLVPRPRPGFRSQATESWAGPGNEATVSRVYFSSCFIVCPRLTSLCSFCSAVSAARRTLSRSILHFLFSSVVCRVLHGSLREQDGAISTTPKLHFENTMVPYQLPLDLRWAVRLPRNNYTCIFKFFTTRVSLFNEYECIYGTTYEYISTYIHTYRHRLRSTR